MSDSIITITKDNFDTEVLRSEIGLHGAALAG